MRVKYHSMKKRHKNDISPLKPPLLLIIPCIFPLHCKKTCIYFLFFYFLFSTLPINIHTSLYVCIFYFFFTQFSFSHHHLSTQYLCDDPSTTNQKTRKLLPFSSLLPSYYRWVSYMCRSLSTYFICWSFAFLICEHHTFHYSHPHPTPIHAPPSAHQPMNTRYKCSSIHRTYQHCPPLFTFFIHTLYVCA